MAKKSKKQNQRKKQNKPKAKEFANLFEVTPKNFSFGGTVQPKIDLTRFVRWPRYVRLQRQKRILMKRLKVPPVINQLTHTATANQTKNLFRLLGNYQPEKKAEKKARLVQMAKEKVENKKNKGKKPNLLKFGLNQVTTLIENGEAKLVVIASDIDPIELICWMPALCRAKDIPFCIVKSKAVLGKYVGLKTTTCVAITSVDNSDSHNLEQLCNNFKAQFNDNTAIATTYGKQVMGIKFKHREEALKKLKEAEIIQKGS